MNTVCLLNDTSNTYHWGCYATSTAIKQRLEESGLKVIPASILLTAYLKAPLNSFDQFNSPQFLKLVAQHNPVLFKILSECDSIVINGEGTLHRLSQNSLNLLYIAYVCKNLLNKKVYLINHSAYPDLAPNAEIAIELYKRVYNTLDYVAIREHISKETMEKIGISSTLSFDCLPLSAKAYTPINDRNPKKLVISDSVIVNNKIKDKFIRLIKDLLKEGNEITLLYGAKDAPAQETEAFVIEMKAQFKNKLTYCSATSLEQWFEELASASALISGRFHYTIAAAFLNTPFVLLDSNTPKNRAIADIFGIDSLLSFSEEKFSDAVRHKLAEVRGTQPLDNDAKAKILERIEANFNFLKNEND